MAQATCVGQRPCFDHVRVESSVSVLKVKSAPRIILKMTLAPRCMKMAEDQEYY